MKTKMVKCPKCKKEIIHLITIGEQNYSFKLDDEGNPEYQTEGYCEGEYPFFCPECDEIITHSEDKAIKFLKSK